MKPEASEVEVLLTVREVAVRWRICTKTVRRMVDRGILHPVRLSARCVRYRTSDVSAALARCIGTGERSTTAESTI
jgi:predicted site-specific integrase-resolvase